MATQGLKNAFFQSDLDARDFTILNLDLTGLGLTKSSVGLGNVDNTSDLNKPISNATQTALNNKEPLIAAGLVGQFWTGIKTWQTYGALALQDGVTTLPIISVKAANATADGVLAAVRNDALAQVKLAQLGASVTDPVLTGVPGANVGMLSFEADSFAVIRSTNSSPIVFGTNNIKRARIGLGLSVGTDSEAGAGCILATGTITGTLSGDGAGITGLVKNQIPGTLNATVVPRLTINGVGGAGYILLGTQSSDPAISAAHLFGKDGRVALGHSGSTSHAISFDNGGLTGDCIYLMPNWTAGTLECRVAVPASAAAAGVAGQKAYDASFEYRCVATNTWKRVAIATW